MNKKLFILSSIFLLLKLYSKSSTSSRELIQPLINIQSQGKGNKEAIEAWPKISQLPPSAIPELLSAMNHANNLGDNWIRAALNKICEQNIKKIPTKEIVNFLKDHSNQGDARHMAFQIIQSYQSLKAKKLIPTFIDDPAPVLRREAVEMVLDQARKTEKEEVKIKLYRKALQKAREVDQIKEASKQLEDAGQEINLTELMGFLMNWHTIGPFDNTERKGFSIDYSPESNGDLNRKHEGADGIISWKEFSSSDELGLLDINQQYGEMKEVCAYAQTTFNSKTEQPAHFRIGSKNAWKMWVNGKLLFARDEYHRGKTRIDQFIIEGKLQKGENQILLKICQNEQTQSWTKQWEFNFRITDPSGSAIHSSNLISK
ncbi:MAG: hypothetical protein QNL65_09135 [Opitutales bacterium]